MRYKELDYRSICHSYATAQGVHIVNKDAHFDFSKGELTIGDAKELISAISLGVTGYSPKVHVNCMNGLLGAENASSTVLEDPYMVTSVIEPTDLARPVAENDALGRERKSQAYRESLPLKAALRALTVGETLSGLRCSEFGRRIANSLTPYLSGDTRIFERRAERKAPSAAIHILLDMSGSMGVPFGEAATQASLALLAGLQSVPGVKTAFSVFPAAACGHRKNHEPVCSLLRFGESFAALDPGYLGVLDPWGSTPLAEAIAYAGVTLQSRREARRIILVITDGGVVPERCIPEVRRMKREGIQFLGIQIGEDNALSAIIPDCALIAHTEEAIHELKRVLLGFAKTIVRKE